MSFKVVKTVEDGEVIITVVPTNWEVNGTLYWPPSDLKDGKKLIQDPKSVPSINWNQIPCTVKEADIESIKTAEKLSRLYLNFNDTEAEIEYFEREKNTNQRNQSQRKRPTTISSQSLGEDYTSSFDQTFIITNSGTLIEDEDENINNTAIITGVDAAISDTQDQDYKKLLEKIEILDKKLEFFSTLYAELKTLIIQLLQNQKNMKIDIDVIEDNVTEDVTGEFLFPLKNPMDVQNFNEKLNDNAFKGYMVKKFISIGGATGTENWKRICSRLMSEMFTNSLLCQYTWKGLTTSKDKSDSKSIFIIFENIIALLFVLCKKACHSCTRMELEKFLQVKIFKRNTQRLRREMLKQNKVDNPNATNHE